MQAYSHGGKGKLAHMPAVAAAAAAHVYPGVCVHRVLNVHPGQYLGPMPMSVRVNANVRHLLYLLSL